MNLRSNDTVQTLMTKEPCTIYVDSSFDDVSKIMKMHCVRHIPVMDQNELVGILSKSDMDKVEFLKSVSDTYPEFTKVNRISVSDIMSKNIRTLEIDDTIKEAAEILSLGAYHALPVMDDNKLVGIITSTDLILYLLRQYNDCC